jgi:hypothetical protein
MTELLQRAIAEIEKLPAERQDAIAARFLAEMADEHAWETSFGKTTDEQWDRMAEAVRHEIAAGAVVPLDELFPSDEAQS